MNRDLLNWGNTSHDNLGEVCSKQNGNSKDAEVQPHLVLLRNSRRPVWLKQSGCREHDIDAAGEVVGPD